MSVAKNKVAELDECIEADADDSAEVEKSEDQQLLDELQPGTTLMHGQYTITKFLNNGGFGITYLAKDSLDRNVVIKECFPSAFCRRTNSIVRARSRAHQGELQSIVRLFVQEARSLSNVVHPNIVGVHQIFEDNDTAYMAIDYVDGKDLLDIIEEDENALKPAQIVEITRKLLEAIGFVHSHDMLHRDISPDNILINSEGEPILIDFGAAREHASNTKRAMSALRVVKDGYSPQEFYISGGQQGPWSDLYSFAASIYHVISGAAPIDGQSRLAAIAEQSDDPYDPLEGRFEGYPPNFLKAIDKAMSVMPNQRMQSAGEWLDMLAGAPGGNASADDRETQEIVAQFLQEARDIPSIDGEPLPSDEKSSKTADVLPMVNAEPKSGRGRMLMSVSALLLLTGAGYVGYQFTTADTVEVAATKEAPENDVAAGDAVAAAADTTPAPVAQGEVLSTDTEETAADIADTFSAATAEATDALQTTQAEETTAETAVAETAPVAEDAPEIVAAPEVEVIDETPAVAAEENTVAPIETTEAEEEAAPVAELEQPAVEAKEITTPPTISKTQVNLAVWDVLMPFDSSLVQVRNAQTAQVTKVSEEADLAKSGLWIKEGVVIFAVNGQPLDGTSSVETLVLNELATDPDGYTRTSVRFKNAETGKFDRGLLSVPVVRSIWLADGSLLQAGMQDGAWVTKVAILGDRAKGTLKVGDVLTKEGVTGRGINSAEDIETIFGKLVDMEHDTAQFSVLRNGEKTTAELSLAMSH